jgi:hypothetical protein
MPFAYDPKKSKYSAGNVKKNLLTMEERKNAPEYLKDQQAFLETTSSSFELQNP